MKKLFLTSSVHAVAHDIASKLDLSRNNKLVFITTPVEPKEEQSDLQWLKNDRQALVDAGFTVNDYTITGKLKSQLEKDLRDFDFIYMSGGDTQYLLKRSQESGFIEVVNDLVINQEKTYIGTSAGSIIAGMKCPDYLTFNVVHSLDNTDGYRLVIFTILPHWGSDDFKDKFLGTRMANAYKSDQVPLLLLTDRQYVFVNGDDMRIIEVA